MKIFIKGSQWSEGQLHPKTAAKFERISKYISTIYPEIFGVDIEIEPGSGFRHGAVGTNLVYIIESADHPEIDGLRLDGYFNKDLSQVEPSSIIRQFRWNYNNYKELKNLRF